MTSPEIVAILEANGVYTNGAQSKTKLVKRLKSMALTHDGGSEASLVESSLSSVANATMRLQITEAFRPAAPETWLTNKNMWLSSNDIFMAMKQYERSNPDFKFIGVTPIDFASRPVDFGGRCVCPEMCSLDITKLVQKQKIKHCGVVLNLDKHDSKGSHWVSVYLGLDPAAVNYGVFYYDSVGVPPKKEVIDWMHEVERCMYQFRNSGDRHFKKQYNKIRRQFGHTECGIFSMVFLIHCIQRDETFENICSSLKGDDSMTSLREVLFRVPRAIPRIGNTINHDTVGGKSRRKQRKQPITRK